jgi:hypothetical protein
VVEDVKAFDVFLAFSIRLFYIVKWGQYFEKWSHLYYQQWYCVLVTLRNQLVLFGNLFCNFKVINMWLFLWHIQDMFAWCICRPPFRWWNPFWHPLSHIFWCTFLTLSIVTRFQQQPFERFKPTHLGMNVLAIDWNFLQGHFCIYFNWIKETSLFSICYFSYFNNWALAKLGNIWIKMGFICFWVNGTI